MKHRLLALLLVLTFLIGLGACSRSDVTSVSTSPDVVMKVLDPSLAQFAVAWETEIGRRFHNSVAVLAHGGQFVEGQWVVGTERIYGGHVEPMEDVIQRVEKLYPGRTIVLLCCNPDHVILHGHPEVWYAKSSVWCVPDRAILSIQEQPFVTATFDTDPDPDEDHGTPAPVVAAKDRWATDPDDAGNIYEFINGR